MNQHDPYDARLGQALADLADARVPDYTPDVLARTRRARQRPAWTFIERWFPMTTIAPRAPVARPLALIPRGLLMLIVLGLLAALAVAGLAIGGRLTSTRAVLPAPVTGPAANGLIAFVRGGDIYVVEPDGSGERPLIVAPGLQEVPVWSRDGTRIAYWSATTESGPWDLVVSGADGTGATIVASGLIEQMDHHPAVVGANWSPDGARLVFSARTVPHGEAACAGETTTGSYCSARIFVTAADGSTEPLAIGDPELDARKPSFSPDGSLIAFGGGDGRTASENRLYVMDSDGSDVRPISPSSGAIWSFARHEWSPDGSEIVSQAGPLMYTDIVLFAADGSGETKLTDTRATDEDAPSFAVDGSLGWRTGAALDCCLEVQAADGVRTDLPGNLPVWSPDASYLVTGGVPLGDSAPKVVIDRAGAVLTTIPEAATPSWQRLAP
jgi:dipeptidyl aminopeptidase/acylaminoacyl peptidase